MREIISKSSYFGWSSNLLENIPLRDYLNLFYEIPTYNIREDFGDVIFICQ